MSSELVDLQIWAHVPLTTWTLEGSSGHCLTKFQAHRDLEPSLQWLWRPPVELCRLLLLLHSLLKTEWKQGDFLSRVFIRKHQRHWWHTGYCRAAQSIHSIRVNEHNIVQPSHCPSHNTSMEPQLHYITFDQRHGFDEAPQMDQTLVYLHYRLGSEAAFTLTLTHWSDLLCDLTTTLWRHRYAVMSWLHWRVIGLDGFFYMLSIV